MDAYFPLPVRPLVPLRGKLQRFRSHLVLMHPYAQPKRAPGGCFQSKISSTVAPNEDLQHAKIAILFSYFFFFLYHGPPLVPSIRPAPFSPRPIAVKLQLSNTRHSETSDCQSCLKCQDEWSFQRRVTTVAKRISTR